MTLRVQVLQQALILFDNFLNKLFILGLHNLLLLFLLIFSLKGKVSNVKNLLSITYNNFYLWLKYGIKSFKLFRCHSARVKHDESGTEIISFSACFITPDCGFGRRIRGQVIQPPTTPFNSDTFRTIFIRASKRNF